MTKEETKAEGTRNFWSFWSTLPGVLTAAATFISAVTGLLIYLHEDTPQPQPQPGTELIATATSSVPQTSPPTAPPTTATTATPRPIGTSSPAPTSPPPTSPPPTVPPSTRCTVFDTDPILTVSPDRAPKGAQVKVTGSGFCPGDLIDIEVHLSNAGSVTTDANGGFVTTITVPQNAPPSGFSTDISADSRSNRGHASAPFTMG